MKLRSLYHYQAKLKGKIVVDNLLKQPFTDSWQADVFDVDTGEVRTLDPVGPYLIVVDPKNKKKQGIEILRVEAIEQVDSRVTFLRTYRGLSKDAFDDVGGVALAQQWTTGTEIGIVTDFNNNNYLKELLNGERTFPNNLEFGGVTKNRKELTFVYTPAYLTCGASPTTTVSMWTAVDDGEFTITIDGVVRHVTGIDFSNGVGGMDQVAAKIQAAIRTITSGLEEVEWDGDNFIIRSGNTTSSSSISVLTTYAIGTGTDISGQGAAKFLDGNVGTIKNKNKGFLITGTVADIDERNSLEGVINGAEVYVSSEGIKYDYLGGAWTPRAAGAELANASEVVTGKVQLATDLQASNGTNTDGGAPLVIKPSQLVNLIQSAGTNFGMDDAVTDAYNIALSPALSSYENGKPISFGPNSSNSGTATININSLGSIPIKKGDYLDLETGDINKNQQSALILNIKPLVFTAVLAMGATSGTLTSNWNYKTGAYSVLFSNTDRRNVNLTNGSNSVTWTGGLSAAAAIDAKSQYAQLISQTYKPSFFFGDGSDGSHTTTGDETLTRDMFYTDLTVDDGDSINTNGFKIFCSGTLIIAATGAIRNNGAVGSPGVINTLDTGGAGGIGGEGGKGGSLPAGPNGSTGGAGGNQGLQGAAGTVGFSSNKCFGSLTGAIGGKGGNDKPNNPQNNVGGLGGAGTDNRYFRLSPLSEYNLYDITGEAVYNFKPSIGSGSGSGGKGGPNLALDDGGGGGGGSGGNGGFVVIFAYNIINNGVIEAKGGSGGKGGNSTYSGGAGGGGGGGNGGTIIIVTAFKLGSGTEVVTGGTGGLGGIGDFNGGGAIPHQHGTAGANGNSGIVRSITFS